RMTPAGRSRRSTRLAVHAPLQSARKGDLCVILTHDVILKEIASGRLVIDPLEADQVGPASIDLHLGDEIRVMEGAPPVIDLDEAADYRTVTQVRPLTEPYILQPGETIHG